MYFFPAAIIILAVLEICTSVPNVSPGFTLTNPIIVPIERIAPKPYEFGYEIADGFGMTQHRREAADATGAVKGSYGYIDPLGVNRIVEYTADSNGYKAVIHSNEPGATSQNTADVVYFVQSPPAAAVAQGLKPLYPKLAI